MYSSIVQFDRPDRSGCRLEPGSHAHHTILLDHTAGLLATRAAQPASQPPAPTTVETATLSSNTSTPTTAHSQPPNTNTPTPTPLGTCCSASSLPAALLTTMASSSSASSSPCGGFRTPLLLLLASKLLAMPHPGAASSFDYGGLSSGDVPEADAASTTSVGLASVSATDMPAGLGPLLGVIGLALGVAVATLGYKLWKYTIFLLGFLSIGSACALTYLAANAQVCVEHSAEQSLTTGDATTACPASYFWMAVLSGVFGGVCGGFCFLGCYMIVLFCAGCQTGAVVYVLVVVYALGALAKQDASVAVDVATNDGSQSAVYVIGVFFSIGMGIVFIKLQKICIMVGTAYLGSVMVWSSVFQGFAHRQIDGLQIFLVFASAVGGFCVQYFKTSKGVEYDKAGKPIDTSKEVLLPLTYAAPMPNQMHVHVQPAPPPPQQTLLITVPDGVGPGGYLQIQHPAGHMVQVQVPAGTRPGHSLQIQL
eukprot:COSAG01_NODE_4143_length_5301_cov_13.838908_5_plen_480_part_00